MKIIFEFIFLCQLSPEFLLEKSACDSEASAGNTSQEEEDSESNKAVVEQQITVPSNTTAESIEPTVGQATCKKKDDSSFPIPDVQNLEENIEEQQQEHTSVIQCGSLNVTSDASLSIEKETIEKEMAHTEEIESQIKGRFYESYFLLIVENLDVCYSLNLFPDVSSFVAHDEINEGKQLPADEELAGNAIETDHNKEVTESQLPSTLLDDSPVVDRKLSHERDSEAVVEPSILEVSISPDETHSALEADRETTAISTHTKDEDERLEVASTKWYVACIT